MFLLPGCGHFMAFLREELFSLSQHEFDFPSPLFFRQFPFWLTQFLLRLTGFLRLFSSLLVFSEALTAGPRALLTTIFSAP